MKHNQYLNVALLVALTLTAGQAVAEGPGYGPGKVVTGQPLSGSARLTTHAKTGAAAQGQARLGERTPLLPPFCEVFDDFRAGQEHEDFERYFQTIDNDGEGRTWGLYNYSDERYSKCAYLKYPINVMRADDWLIPRAIRLEAGKYYNVNMDASLFTDGAEHLFEVKMGYYNDVPGMEFDVIPETLVNSRQGVHVSGWFCAPDDGLFYMGIHGTSYAGPSNGNYLFVDNIAIDAARSGAEPLEVADVDYTNAPDGSPMTTVSFIAPATAINGSALTGPLTVKLTLDGTTYTTLNDVQPGSVVTCPVTVADEGTYEFGFTVSNASGDGATVVQKHFVGVGAPVMPVITEAVAVGLTQIKLAWEAPATDVNGTALDPSALTYNVYDVSSGETVLKKAGLQATEYTVTLPSAANEQIAAVMVVTASINGKESFGNSTDVIFVGAPYQLPYSYSFAETGLTDYILAVEGDQGITWQFLDDFSDPDAQDGDNGYLCMIGMQPDITGAFITGKIDFTTATNPFVSLYTYVYPDDENIVELLFLDAATGEREVIGYTNLGEVHRMGWHRLIFPMKDMVGRVGSIIVQATIISHGYVPFDNLVVAELPATAIDVKLLSTPRYADVDEAFDVFVEVTNTGADVLNGYTLRLLDGDKVMAQADFAANLQSFDSEVRIISYAFPPDAASMTTFTVEAVKGNASAESPAFSVACLMPVHPTATDLTAQTDGDAVTLSWTAADISKGAPAPVLEDFESYPAFTTELGNGWTMYDGDKGFVVGLNSLDMPVTNTQQAWWTMRKEAPYDFIFPLDQSCLVQMASIDANRRPVRNDDWLISPRLYGGRQNIGFSASALNIAYGYDEFEVFYSTSGNQVSDFSQIMATTTLDEVWEDFFVALPEGTNYFAIRCVSNDTYMMMLDNIMYIPEGVAEPLELRGYNVYCNGERLNAVPVEATSYATTRRTDSDRYFVTAVYDRGESAASNVVTVGNSGIGSVVTDAATTPAEYYDMRGMRVDPAKALPGIYICRRGTDVTKVVIR